MRGVFRGKAALAVALASLAGGCALFRGAEGEKGAAEVTLTAGPRLNPDDSGQSLPTVFRILLLASASRAESASYEALYRGDKDALGEDVLAQEEVVLNPGETVTRRISADRPARALLVLGIFRKPTGTSWRVIVPIEGGRPRAASFRAEDYRVDRQ